MGNKRRITVSLALSMLLLAVAGMQLFAGIGVAASVSLLNAVQFKSSDGNVLHAHGGGVIKVGSYYYWAGENRDGTNYVSLYRSTDLKNWQFRAHILSKSSAAELATANIERPKIIYNAATNKYVLWAHKENGVDYGEARVAVASSTNIEGPYTYHGSFRPLGYDSRDMTVYNDNGTGYLISATKVNADLNIYRLTPDFLGVEALVTTLWPGSYREAPAIFKRGSTYFLLTSGATGWNPNQAKYATASSISGPWSALANFGDATTYGSQSTYVLPVEGSSTTSYLYMGDRWAGAWSGPVNDSKYVWLPLSFPTATTLSMTWYPKLNIDTATGSVSGVAFSVDTNAYYEIVSRKSNKLLSIRGNSLVNGADAEQMTDTNSASQQWRFIDAGGGYYKIQNRASGLILGLTNGNTADGTIIEQWADGGYANQQWQLVHTGGGFFKLKNRDGGKLIDVSSGSLDDGANVIEWTDNGGTNQQWQIVEAN
ncbi:sucrose-6-phosphate hydrolase SacC (GH32 family) [Paenibacillus phyllosphaerae]|uniref:Sucrose-6-phosphate hydrolase SacC (GH32 family) n=1 Tax=Paenibacillus phyllosphaerae TaxID=274593 RepID=A0A7W5FQ31_9BACL|nr:RICIN domain-containing protein [Paenibacillus phyllosphaerae]MBB3112812.1 sucrose-6-phosphate hydrolase SacC (GH32 family) [Paenibacillus phyllosphaerae]